MNPFQLESIKLNETEARIHCTQECCAPPTDNNNNNNNSGIINIIIRPRVFARQISRQKKRENIYLTHAIKCNNPIDSNAVQNGGIELRISARSRERSFLAGSIVKTASFAPGGTQQGKGTCLPACLLQSRLCTYLPSTTQDKPKLNYRWVKGVLLWLGDHFFYSLWVLFG
jgi:hypothetical protein